MTTRAHDAQLIGVTVDGPPPLGRIFVSLQEPVCTTLYGRNGAGKTRLLDAVTDALSGVARPGSLAMVHMRVPTTETPYDEPRSTAPLEQMVLDAAVAHLIDMQGHLATKQLATEGPLTDWETLQELGLQTTVTDSLHITLEQHYSLGPEARTLSEAIASQQLFSFVASGTEGSPRWQVYVSARDGSPGPPLGVLAQLVRERGTALGAGFVAPLGDRDPANWDEPLALVAVGSGDFSAELPVVFREGVFSIDGTLRTLSPGGEWLEARDGAVTVAPEALRRQHQLEKLANRILHSVLVDAPDLRCLFREPNTWAHEDAVEWQARDKITTEWVPLPQLSYAQRRWAHLAVSLAVGLCGSRGVACVLIDEPERGLHRVGERQAIDALFGLAGEVNAPVLVASHSAEALNHPEMEPWHVTREGEGRSVVRPLEWNPDRLAILEELGVERADLLQGTRTFLLVEGVHDEWVLDTLIGSELKRLRVRILRLQGFTDESPLLHVVQSQFLFDHTDASFVVLVDNAGDGQRIRSVWESLRDAPQDRPEHAFSALNDFFEKLRADAHGRAKGLEHLQNLLNRALESGVDDRVEPFGFERGDVIEYLPVEKFVPGETWDSLRAEWLRTGRGPGTDFKDWLSEAPRKARFRESVLRSAAASLDSVPPEFKKLLDVCAHRAG